MFGETKVLPSSITDKVQVFPVPTTMKQFQEFFGCNGILVILYTLLSANDETTILTNKKKDKYGIEVGQQDAFQQEKTAIKQAQVLDALNPVLPAELDMCVI